MKARGIALHYFDSEPSDKTGDAKHDKFYRIYLYATGTTATPYAVLSNWGRDNPGVEGQSKTEVFSDFAKAKKYMEKLGDSKMRKGYEYLGEADVTLDPSAMHRSGERLLTATGRRATKIPGFSVMITEDEDIFDLLAKS